MIMDAKPQRKSPPLEHMLEGMGEIFPPSGLPSSEELRRIGHGLIDLAEALAPLDESTRKPVQIDDILSLDSRLADLAEAIYRARRLRSKTLSAELFGEAAWDMLLDLFINAVRKRRITVTSLCIASDVPSTTALRWIGILVAEGLVERVPVAVDQRATEVRLTDEGYATMRQCLSDSLIVTKC